MAPGSCPAPLLISGQVDAWDRSGLQRGKALFVHARPIDEAIQGCRMIHGGGRSTNNDVRELKFQTVTGTSSEGVFEQRPIVGVDPGRAASGQFPSERVVGEIVA